jgi:hypothetical protein
VIRRYLKRPYRIVFLGDYVDRGSQSEGNLLRLLSVKVQHPEQIYLLAGNHEGFVVRPFYPANYWESLPDPERKRLGEIFSRFPLAATARNGILALHGALPDMESLGDIDQIVLGDENWQRIVWGDFVETDGEDLGEWGGRPQFGRQYFERLMQRYRRKILIRSHQPRAPQRMFGEHCITIFSSYAYMPTRFIAIVDLEKEVGSAQDVILERI